VSLGNPRNSEGRFKRRMRKHTVVQYEIDVPTNSSCRSVLLMEFVTGLVQVLLDNIIGLEDKWYKKRRCLHEGEARIHRGHMDMGRSCQHNLRFSLAS
jgi:hypothetical protein